ncbi:hypothetical protein AAH995_28190 [Pseudomonas putida]|uniref:hypothetical protein n=1 Tax=Pseudomonas TaxID=286 RepID=UPI000629FB8B|nr:hypothetical protein [Pseudomonas putida]
MDLMALIQQALEASGKLRDLSKKVGDADFKMILADLHSALADAKLESGELKMKLALAQEEIVRLKQLIEQRDKGKLTYNSEGSIPLKARLVASAPLAGTAMSARCA